MIDRPAGDAESLVGRLYDTHGPALYRYAVMLLADAAAAEDAVHQVFASLLRQGGRINLDNEAHYLRRAVRNECCSLRRRRHVAALDDRAMPLLEPCGVDTPIEERLTLERAIRALPMDQREVVHLHVFEGLTFQETAAALGESINTVSSRYRYALQKLRKHFDR
jgi:RNA polymerase sigma-70 factor (ECF subfamily)